MFVLLDVIDSTYTQFHLEINIKRVRTSLIRIRGRRQLNMKALGFRLLSVFGTNQIRPGQEWREK